MQAGFFEQHPGKKSMLRLLAFLGFILGGLVSIWSLVLLTNVVNSVLAGNTEAIAVIGSLILLISAGLALAGGSEILKTLQKKSEILQGGVNDEKNDVGMGDPGNSDTQRSPGSDGL